MFKKTMLALTATAALFAGQAQAAADFTPLKEDPKTISFGIIATESTQALSKQWQPLIDDMSKALGMPVKAFFASDYAGIIEGMRFGKVQVAWFGNKSGMEAVDRAGGEVFVQTTNADGTIGYNSLMLAPANSPLNSLEDLLKCDKSIDFGIGDPNSTSGFLVPSYYVFAMNNVDPKDCFKTVRNANHETNLMAVAMGQVGAATNNTEQWDRTAKNKPEIIKKIKAIWKSPLIPSDPMVYRKDLSYQMKALIKGFFLAYGRLGPNKDAELAVLKGISSGMGPFKDSSNAQLYPIRQLALFKDKVKTAANENMSDAEKKAKIAEIDAQLKVVETLVANQ